MDEELDWTKIPLAQPRNAPERPFVPTPEEQQKINEVPVAQEAPPPAATQADIASDVARSFGSGVVRGTVGLADSPGDLTKGVIGQIERRTGYDVPDWAERGLIAMTPGGMGRAIMGESTAEALNRTLPSVANYKPKTTAGGYAGTVGEFLPGMLFPAGRATMLERFLYNVAAPAVTSETAGNVAKSYFPDNKSAEAYARLLGAFAGGPFAKTVETGIRATQFPKVVDPFISTLDRNGVTTTAGNVRQDPRLLAIEATAPRTAEILANQGPQFRNAALTKAGVTLPTEGQTVMEVLNAARNDAGLTYSRVTNGLSIVPNSRAVTRMKDIASGYGTNVEAGLQSGTIKQIQSAVENAFRTGQPISPKQFGLWRSAINKATTSASPTVRQYAIDTLKVMDDVIGRSLALAGRRDDIALLGQARAKYRDILAIEDALFRAGKMGEEGMFTPTNLANALAGQGRKSYMRGQRGELGALAAAGRARLTPVEAIPPYKGSKAALAAGLAADAAAGLAGNYIGAKLFPDYPMFAYSIGPALATATEMGRRGLGAMARNIYGSEIMQEAMKRIAQNPASGASGLTGGIVGAVTGSTSPQAYGGRVERKAGGRVGIDHDRLADQLVGAAERAKKGISRSTEQLLDLPDDHIAHALEVANRSI